jgi:hypothetical protein
MESDQLTVEFRVFDPEGRRQIASEQRVLRVPASAQPRGLDVVQSLRLPPGLHNIRVSAMSASRNVRGSVHTDVTVPNYQREPVTWSDAIISASPGRSLIAGFDALQPLPVIPTTLRVFSSTNSVEAFIRAYWSAGHDERLSPVTVRTWLANVAGQKLNAKTIVLQPDQSRSKMADLRLPMPIADLAPGEYLLTLEASAPLADKVLQLPTRFVRFTVSRDPSKP